MFQNNIMTIKERKKHNANLLLVNLKMCCKCNKIKSLQEYHINKRMKSGYKSACKVCIKKQDNSKSYKLKEKIRKKKYIDNGSYYENQKNRKKRKNQKYTSFIEESIFNLKKQGYKQISQNNRFYVNEYGDIKKLPTQNTKSKTWKIEDAYVTKNHYGYLKFNMNAKPFRVHQIVAQEFLGHNMCGHKLVIDHIDGNILNNHYSNLQIVSNYENLAKGMYNKTKQKKFLKYIKNIKY